MKDRDFKMRERWKRKEQERLEHFEEKEMKRLEKEKREWYEMVGEDNAEEKE